MDELDNNLKTIFCTAANNVTQIYMKSLENQKISYSLGQKESFEKISNFIEKNSTKVQGKNVVDSDLLLEFIKTQMNKKEWESRQVPSGSRPPQENWKPTTVEPTVGTNWTSGIPLETFNFSNSNQEQKPFIFQPVVFQESNTSGNNETFVWNENKKREPEDHVENQNKRVKFF
jgi:hypothetical protein